MKKQQGITKKITILSKYKIFNISVQQMALAGVVLSLITVFKIFDNFIPKTQLGVSWVELYMIFAVIMVLFLPFGISFLVLVSAPFLWFAAGQTWQTSPLSFFLDYSLPLLSILVVYLARFVSEKFLKVGKFKISTKQISIFFLIILGFILKWFFHTISGVISWNTPWEASAALNAPYVFVTMAVTVPMTLSFLPKIEELQKMTNINAMGW